ncbi:hypothetical protein QGN29_10935 [Temperatibacter marinus]|uniref:Uncharacterized protein n=1 Tax=Temperatibacter marinus TaxID=1456591 RepID=A0AA52H920_9PROT|nr:hypothetical protein [Temperatibacter marinus]WND02062.1 hypothetical protein QGN29_10935 [Temperatibacter marinus]
MDKFMQSFLAERAAKNIPQEVKELLLIRQQAEQTLRRLDRLLHRFHEIIDTHGPEGQRPLFDQADCRAIRKVKNAFLEGGISMPSHSHEKEEGFAYQGLKALVKALKGGDSAHFHLSS